MRAAVAVLLLSAAAWAEGPLVAPPKVKLVRAVPMQSTARESVSGSLFPAKLLPMGFEVGGRLAMSFVTRGAVVKTGQALGSLDTEIVDAQVLQAEAGLAAAEAGAGLALDMAGRSEKLKAEGSMSDVQSRSSDVQAKQAAAQVALAKAQLAQARAARKRHEVRALFPGLVIDAPDNVGGMVGPGMPVFVISQVDSLTLKATVPEKLRDTVKPGLKVRVEAVGGSAATDDAVVRAVIPSADPQTRRVPIEVTVPNADGRFTANTLARVSLPAGEAQAAVVLPSTAVSALGGDHLFTVDASGTLKRVSIRIIERRPTEVVVVPATPVESAVDYPSGALVEGTKVTQR
ncbi:MAG: efflux RND transporter periplasmic adaptor subunit [Archangium sp.]|nr:efflux RND transporter periplasmic adaptor subunit [Archangium sp.]